MRCQGDGAVLAPVSLPTRSPASFQPGFPPPHVVHGMDRHPK
jgi:hypothetical protein